MSIESCSLYEFRITAVSRYGESKPIYLVQYTEPQLSPQHILANKLNANTVELTWDPPYKRTHDVKVWEYSIIRKIYVPYSRIIWFILLIIQRHDYPNGRRSPCMVEELYFPNLNMIGFTCFVQTPASKMDSVPPFPGHCL